MTKKKKTKATEKTPSAYSRFYPPVKKDWPEKKRSKKVGDEKKEVKKNEASDGKDVVEQGNQTA